MAEFELPAGFFDIAQTFARCFRSNEKFAEGGNRRRAAREQSGIAGPAARLDQLRGGEIVEVEQRRRREIDEACALIRPVVEHLGDAERARADA